MALLGKYELRDQLGIGSMGIVYRARDTVLDRAVALKVIRTGTDSAPDVRKRFYQEARSCGRLQHPHIVTIYDLGETDQIAFIAMELLEGSDFRKVIDNRQVGSLAEKIELMIQTCDALGHAHRNGVIHRDVKPRNLFLTGGNCVKVLDFGIARLPSSRLTVAGYVLGTPNYMAPEQLAGRGFDGRADLFSAAVVFFELLVGQHPFRGTSIPQRIADSEPDSLFDYDSDLPVLLEKVFTRAFAKDPDHRYATGDAFTADLRTVLGALNEKNPMAFSRITLPSDNPAPAGDVPPAAELAIATARAPEGEDSAEWRYSEVLELIPLFESAIERNDASGARRHFENLQHVTAGDRRFDEAVLGCKTRLEKMSWLAQTVVLTPSTSLRICLQCGTGNRSAARFCIECGADLEDEAQVEEAPPVSPFDGNATPPDGKSLPEAVLSVPSPARPGFPERAVNWVKAHPRHAIVDVAALLLVALALVGLSKLPKPFTIEHAVASADAGPADAEVFQSATTTSRRLYRVPKGATLNILELPSAALPKWVHVQAIVKNEPQQPGFAQRNQLSGWKGWEAGSEFVICCLSANELTTDQGITSRREVLRGFVSQFPQSAEAVGARRESARLALELAKRHQAQGLSGDALKAELNGAREESVKAGEGAHDLTAEIDSMIAGIAPEPSLPLPTAFDPLPLLSEIQQLIINPERAGGLMKAQRLLNRVLKEVPTNPEALRFQKQLKAIQDASQE